MIIKKAKYKKVKVLQTRIVEPEVYGCDCCRKEIKDYPNEAGRLELTVFRNSTADADHYHLCSWTCVFKFAAGVKTDYFFTLPYVSFDGENTGRKSAKEFIRLVKKAITP